MSIQDDEEAIHLCRQGDSRGLELLMRRYQLPAIRVAYLILGNQPAAEDAVQESFVQAWNAIHRFDPQFAFLPWLMRIVVNAARMRQRSSARHLTISIEQIDPEDDILSSHAAQDDPVAHVEQAEAHAAMMQALSSLTPLQREAIVLRYYGGYDAPAIAHIVGCRPDAVRRRIHDGLIVLKRVISQHYHWLTETLA